MRRLIGRICLLVLAVVAAASAPATAGGYHVIREIPVGGEGGWDYLVADAATRRLYVSHATQVEVLDMDSGAVVGKILKTPGVHGIALASDLGRGFTSNGRAATVTIFDLKTLATQVEVPTGKNPDAILFDPATQRRFHVQPRQLRQHGHRCVQRQRGRHDPVGGAPRIRRDGRRRACLRESAG
jgi:hypothetical protein